MKKIITFSLCLFVFFFGLFLFKAIFPALFLSLLFWIVDNFCIREKPLQKSIFFKLFSETTINLIISVFVSLMIYCVIYLPIEFFLTEILFIAPKLSRCIPVIFLLNLIFFSNFISWNKVLRKKGFLSSVLLTLSMIALMTYRFYRQEKLTREYLPKIYRVCPSWGIQATKVEIEGVSFGHAWQKGKILLGEEEMNILSWENKRIVGELPVPKKVGKTELYVLRNDGRLSNKSLFEIKDPSFLLE